MSSRVSMPPPTAGTEAERIRVIYLYLQRLAEEINAGLDGIDADITRSAGTASGETAASYESARTMLTDLRADVGKRMEALRQRIEAVSVQAAGAVEKAETAQAAADAAQISADMLRQRIDAMTDAVNAAVQGAETALAAVEAAEESIETLAGVVRDISGETERGAVTVSASSTDDLSALGIITEAGVYRITLAGPDAASEYVVEDDGTVTVRLQTITEGATDAAPVLSAAGVLSLRAQAAPANVRWRLDQI